MIEILYAGFTLMSLFGALFFLLYVTCGLLALLRPRPMARYRRWWRKRKRPREYIRNGCDTLATRLWL